MNKDEQKKRDDEICKKIDANEKICYTCKHFIENRTPESILEHGEFSGVCDYNDESTPGVNDEMPAMLIVMADSTCDKHESLFPPDQ